MRRNARQVARLARIRREVVQLIRLALGVAMHILPVARADHPRGPILVKREHSRVIPQRFPAQHRREIPPRQPVGIRVGDARVAQQRGHKVVLTEQFVAHQILRRVARPRHKRRHFHRGIVHIRRICAVALAPDAVMPHIHPVVRVEHNQRVFAQPVCLQPVKQPPDIPVHFGHRGEIAAQRQPAIGGRIANRRRALFFGELRRVHRLHRQRIEGAVFVKLVKNGGGMMLPAPRRVRRGVMHIQRKRRVRAEPPVQERQRVVGDDVRHIPARPRELPVKQHRRVVVWPAARRVYIPEREPSPLQRRMSQMPLAAQPALIARLRQQFHIGRLPRDIVYLGVVVV